jgi:hypothetical protein
MEENTSINAVVVNVPATSKDLKNTFLPYKVARVRWKKRLIM